MANYILDNSGNISHIKYKGQWVGQVNYKAYGASSPTRLSWSPLHTSVNGWFNNTSYHWQNCDTCGWQFSTGTHEGNYNEWSQYTYHDINANNHSQNRQRACIVCGHMDYDNSIEVHSWTIKGTWTYNAQDDAKHYRTNGCICGHVGAKDSAAHGGSSTWLNNANKHYHQCPSSPTGCGHVWAVASHTWSSWVNTDPSNHWKECTVCGRENEKAPHTTNYVYINTSCHNNRCNVCYHVFNSKEAHDLDETSWSKDSTGHWRVCFLCEGKGPTASHTPSWLYNSSKHWKNCTVCDYQTMAPASHTYTTWNTTYTSYSNLQHYNNYYSYCDQCSYLNYTNTRESHTYAYTSLSRTKHNNHCTLCTWNNLESHTDGSDWYKNGTNHWHKCVYCGNDTSLYSHTWSNTITGNYYNISDTQHNTQYNNHCTTTGCGYYQFVNVAESHNKYAGEWSSWSWGEWQNGTWGSWSDYSETQHRRQRTNTRTGERARAWSCYNCDYDYTQTETGSDSAIEYGYDSHHFTSKGAWTNYSNTQHSRTNKCAECSRPGAVDYADHTSYGSWTDYGNAQYHRRQCGICQGYNYGAHTPTQGSWDANSSGHWRTNLCSICSYNFGNDFGSHVGGWGPWVNFSNTQHYRQYSCVICGYDIDQNYASHANYGAWSYYDAYVHKRQCGDCQGYNYMPHTWSYSNYNSTQHRKNCSLCNYHTLENHTWSPWSGWSSWTMDNNETHSRYNTHYCTATGCGYTVTTSQTESHSLDPEWSYDDTNHWKMCSKCSYNNFGTHDIRYEEIGDQDVHIKYCNICSYAVEDPHNMAPNLESEIIEPLNSTHHGYYHTGYCTLCTYTYDGPMFLYYTEQHVMRQGRCAICGYQP